MFRKPFTLMLHVALIIILVGAIVTHFCGIQGSVSLRFDASAVTCFDKESGPGDGVLPFAVSLDSVEIVYYPATVTPMDFRSVISVEGRKISVAMNKVGVCDGWRFYQSGIGPESSTLSVSYDPWGTGITYFGYLMLGIGMIGYFFQKRTVWRSLLKKYRLSAILFILLCTGFNASATADGGALPVMQRPLAANFGKVLVYWNDRICPIRTLARDVATSLYGTESYRGYTPEQILSGWLFYYDDWRRDYFRARPEILSLPPQPQSKREKKAAERLALVEWLGTGDIFRIYPYRTVDGRMEWLSLTGRRPSGMSLEQWTFMQTSMTRIKDLLMKGKNVMANQELSALMEGQRKYAVGVDLPSEAKIRAERTYNVAVRPALAAILAVCFGLAVIILSLCHHRFSRALPIALLIVALLLFLYVGASMGALWWISGHIPLSNGPETMMFMAVAAFAGASVCRNLTMHGGLLMVGAMALFVAAMGGRNPQIGAMMPVLGSPLLAVHVMLVMISYTLFLLMTILSAVALLSRSESLGVRLSLLNRIILPPAVCLLGAGIFIGAVWANQTWGRYWGWDPKETCALVMWLIYALPLHSGIRRLAFFRSPRTLHIYLLAAVLSMLFTYFGANYFLHGLHSYA
ncbi:MAG: cytochrome c biogenesis protein CcsA [Muribaculaceae bacterium]|nr:cytochrome c biogenesis protein CcsA [Muribaculaceae bacterium]